MSKYTLWSNAILIGQVHHWAFVHAGNHISYCCFYNFRTIECFWLISSWAHLIYEQLGTFWLVAIRSGQLLIHHNSDLIILCLCFVAAEGRVIVLWCPICMMCFLNCRNLCSLSEVLGWVIWLFWLSTTWRTFVTLEKNLFWYCFFHVSA